MIQITDKQNCCGCEACVSVCPLKCIEFNEDSYGFRYPVVDVDKCVDCGLCEKVCPVINQTPIRIPTSVYAAKNLSDEVRLNSSSGGVFTLIAETVIDNGGVVFGAKFNDKFEVVHAYTETKEGLLDFRGSKYVQSRIGDAFISVQAFLKQGREVLFTGTPCQIAGLRKFLRKEYSNLLLLDVVCHGVPSPLIWRTYLSDLTKNLQQKEKAEVTITKVNFRDKSEGWRAYNCLYEYNAQGQSKVYKENHRENLFMRLFLSDLILRPSCFNCPAKNGQSGSDITLGDFWRIERTLPLFDDDNGVSLLVQYNAKMDYVEYLLKKMDAVPSSNEAVVQANPYIITSVKRPYLYDRCWRLILNKNLDAAINELDKFQSKLFIRTLKNIKMRIIKFLKK